MCSVVRRVFYIMAGRPLSQACYTGLLVFSSFYTQEHYDAYNLFAQGDKNSPVALFFGGSTPAYVFIIAFFFSTIINMEGCLLVLVSNFIGKENRCVAKAGMQLMGAEEHMIRHLFALRVIFRSDN